VVARRDGVGESERQRIAVIRRSQPALPHIGFVLKLKGIATVFESAPTVPALTSTRLSRPSRVTR
jgi:hypothetical protein